MDWNTALKHDGIMRSNDLNEKLFFIPFEQFNINCDSEIHEYILNTKH
jgi:hypothetical protein